MEYVAGYSIDIACSGGMEVVTQELLIINADDFGIHEDVNDGIIQAYLGGLVRSTSLLVNMPATGHAVQLAKEHPELEVGLHLNISSQFCVAPVHHVHQIVDSEGRFLFDGRDIPGSMKRLKTTIEQNPEIIDQVVIEFESQIERFYELDLKLGHVNIHHYLSLLHPRLFEAYVSTAEAASVPFRGLCYPILDILRTSPNEVRQMAKLISDSKASSPEYSISNLLDVSTERLSVSEYRQRMEAKLADLAQHDNLHAVEIITHPAVISSTVRELDSYAWARELETALVTSHEFRALVKKLGYRVGGYSALWAT